jgi:hypothetical protein
VAASNPSAEIADRAVALAGGSDDELSGARATLIKLAGDQVGLLEGARDVLVRRIRLRSDDFPATSGLSLLNATLSKLGKADNLEWQPKVWRLPR